MFPLCSAMTRPLSSFESGNESGQTPEMAGEEGPFGHNLSPGSKPPPLPWHIKLLGGAFALYVILRLIQIAGWIIRWMTES